MDINTTANANTTDLCDDAIINQAITTTDYATCIAEVRFDAITRKHTPSHPTREGGEAGRVPWGYGTMTDNYQRHFVAAELEQAASFLFNVCSFASVFFLLMNFSRHK